MQAGDSADVPKGNQELIKQGTTALPESEFPSNALTSDLRNPVMKVSRVIVSSRTKLLVRQRSCVVRILVTVQIMGRASRPRFWQRGRDARSGRRDARPTT